MQSFSPSRSERDQEEIQRSAIEAARIVLAPISVDRYLNPSLNAAYALEFAYFLLGDVRGRTVLDLGCGSGQNLIALASRGANVLGVDISPHLIRLAQQRLDNAGKVASLRVATAYDTGVPEESIDVVFAIAVLHHLELPVVREEIRRMLRKNGRLIFSEPIRFSRTLNLLRTFFPARDGISSHEHPLNRADLAAITEGFTVMSQRNFRLPFIPLLGAHRSNHDKRIWETDRWLNQHFPKLEHYATVKVMSLKRSY
jgi:2-polyprenyl-3-methyl-5-hydroxy-6-metoxy-1,4-benzoquinol methylase